MARTLEEIREEALQLDIDQRELLAHDLYASVEQHDPDVERAWIEVAQQRLRDLQTGKAKTVPLEEALASMREMLDAPSRTTRRS